jgi:hypothetical protein
VKAFVEQHRQCALRQIFVLLPLESFGLGAACAGRIAARSAIDASDPARFFAIAS